jgi:hypothetical protein
MRVERVPRRINQGTTHAGGCNPPRRRLSPEMAPLEPRQISADPPHQRAKVRTAQLAAGQFGQVSHRQLKRLGVTNSTVRDWRRAGYLHPRLPGVHAVGHPGRTVAAELFEAVLYAGPGAMLSHTTAAWWQGLIEHPSPLTHVSTPRRRVAPRGIMIDGRRRLTRAAHNGIPVTTPEQTVFDLAACCVDDPFLARVALAQLDFEGRYDPDAILALCQRGVAGSERLRAAIAQFDPRFASTRSRFERDWIVYCERTHTPKPDAVNVLVHSDQIRQRLLRRAADRQARRRRQPSHAGPDPSRSPQRPHPPRASLARAPIFLAGCRARPARGACRRGRCAGRAGAVGANG